MPKIPATMPEPGSVRHHQAAATNVLRDLLMHDLPTLYLAAITREGRLELQTSTTLTDGGDLAAVHAWAEFFGTVMTARAYAHDGAKTRISAETTVEGVRVEVWTSILTPEPRRSETGPLIDPDCRDGKCSSCVGGPCEHECHRDPVDLGADTGGGA